MSLSAPRLVAGMSRLERLLRAGVPCHEVDRGIVSVLPKELARSQYDVWARVVFYDHVVASRLYNRVVWGTTPTDYVAFEKRALGSRPSGWVLNAGCGSLVFTAELFAHDTGRPVVLLDRSLRMLRRARHRLDRLCGQVPEHLILVQGDLFDLPFKTSAFATVSCPAVIHAFEDPAQAARQLVRVLAPAGTLFLTSLVTVPGRGFANRYLRGMHRGGEIAAPRSATDVAERLTAIGGLMNLNHKAIGSMGYFTADALMPTGFWR